MLAPFGHRLMKRMFAFLIRRMRSWKLVQMATSTESRKHGDAPIRLRFGDFCSVTVLAIVAGPVMAWLICGHFFWEYL